MCQIKKQTLCQWHTRARLCKNMMLKCTSRSWVQVTLCAADRHRVTEMMRSTDFQIQEALCLASVGQIWSMCFYKDNHRTGQWPGRGLLLAGRGSLQLLGNIKNLGHGAAGNY